LTAFPGTRLWRRLKAEGRLRSEVSGDNFERPNFEPLLDERELLAGFRRLVAVLYQPERYYARCALVLEQLPRRALAGADAGARGEAVLALVRIAWGLGVKSPRRRHFWRLARHALRLGAGTLPRAMALAVLGESLIPYTEEVVLPRIDRALEDLARAAEFRGAVG
jgi:hypothetical protein